MTLYYKRGRNVDGLAETPFIHTGKTHFLIRCAVCHEGLCKLTTIIRSERREQNLMFVEPCPRCLAAARNDAEVDVIPLDELPDMDGVEAILAERFVK